MMKRIVAIILMAGCMSLQPLGTETAQAKYLIRLANGSEITTSSYYEENGMLYYYKYGGYIGIQKSDVIEAGPVGRQRNAETVTLDPEFEKQSAKRDAEVRRRASSASTASSGGKMSECEQKKKYYEKEVRIYCGTVEGMMKDKSVPTAESMVHAVKAGRSCSYAKDMLEHWRKKCP